MEFHLKLAATVSIAWLIVLALRPVPGAAELVALLSIPGTVLLAAIHLVLAGLFWWGSGNPPERLPAVWVGLVVFAVRAPVGIYLVLYGMAGPAAMIVLIEMVLSIGILAAIINGLPPVLRPHLRK